MPTIPIRANSKGNRFSMRGCFVESLVLHLRVTLRACLFSSLLREHTSSVFTGGPIIEAVLIKVVWIHSHDASFFLSAISCVMKSLISSIHPLDKTTKQDVRKQYCLQGGYHLMTPSSSPLFLLRHR